MESSTITVGDFKTQLSIMYSTPIGKRSMSKYIRLEQP